MSNKKLSRLLEPNLKFYFFFMLLFVVVAIIGHTDKSGNDNINIPLSQRRAESVANYLKAQGVSYGQIRSIQGVGSSQPVPGHENNVKDAANRRVEVYLYASEAMIKKAEAGTLN